MLISCKFENGRIRSFNLDYCVEIMIDDKRIELELLRGKDCSTIVITPEIITNFNEVSDKILTFIKLTEVELLKCKNTFRKPTPPPQK